MKFILNKNALDVNPERFLRQAGYKYIEDRRHGTNSFVRRFGRNSYPRFHMYIEEESDKIIFNLHLDQKQPSYKGSHAHNAEYEGQIVQNEADRIKGLIKEYSGPVEGVSSRKESIDDPLKSMKEGEYKKEEGSQKKSWLQKLFS